MTTVHGRGHGGLVTTTAAVPSATKCSSRLLFLLTAIDPLLSGPVRTREIMGTVVLPVIGNFEQFDSYTVLSIIRSHTEHVSCRVQRPVMSLLKCFANVSVFKLCLLCMRQPSELQKSRTML